MSHKITVCVVDDDVESASVLCEGLKLYDLDAIGVHSGEEALARCNEGGIDLVLLDVLMPGMDGFEVCEKLRESPATAEIPVIFVTVKGEIEDFQRGYRLGALDYITKPYNLPMVLVRVESALQRVHADDKMWLNEDGVMDPSYTDQLTGLRNRKFLMNRLQEEIDKAHRYDFPVSCVMFDVDDVEAVDNDTGPVSDDDLLAELAMSLRNYTRTHDVLARFDGSMFCAILPHTALDDALGYTSKIMNEVDATTFSDPNFPTKARLSVGIVTCRNGTAKNADFILGEAMRSLLEAKGKPDPEERITGRMLEDE